MQTNDTILVLRTTTSPASQLTRRALKSEYRVRYFDVIQTGKLAQIVNAVKQALWLLWWLPSACGVYFRFCDWFALPAAALTRVFRKRLWITIGGYESHCFPEHGYGVWQSRLRGAVVKYALRSATRAFAVHQSLIDGMNTYSQPPRRTGIAQFVQANTTVVPNGFDAEYWCPAGFKARKRVLTTANDRGYLLKGVPMVLAVARLLPEYTFAIAGITRLREDLPPNVIVLGWLSREELRDEYRKARVYLHPSLTEGLPGSVAEAMLCECVPVTSNVNGTPDLVGDTGFVVGKPDPELYAIAVRAAVGVAALGTGARARERIVYNYSYEKHAERLLDSIRDDA